MEINLDHDSIGAIVVHAISTLERAHGNYQPFRNKLARITDDDIRDMRKYIKENHSIGFNNEPIDVATYFLALFDETAFAIQDAIKILQSGSGDENEIVLLFLLLTQHTNCLTCLAMIAGGGLLSESQKKEYLDKEIKHHFTLKADKRWEKDPKTQAKALVKDCWEEWQSLDPEAQKKRYKSKAAFARDMLEKFEDLCSTKVIEDWCRKWEKRPKP